MAMSPLGVSIVVVAMLLSLGAGDNARAGDAGTGPAPLPKIAELPTMVASCGAAIADDWLYVYGGHTGKTHSYSTEQVSGSFRRVNLRDGGPWQELPSGPKLQGLVLVEQDGLLYRIGGMTARNAVGQAEDLHSLADVARFDPQTAEWTSLPPLPEGRSSHAAAVLDGQLYVIGGWQLRGQQEPRWHATSLVLDLRAKQLAWKKLPEQPFERRALAAAADDGKLYALGGLQSEGGISTRTDVFDTRSQTWSAGPVIPGIAMNANGVAACTAGERMYLSGIDGNIYCLGADHASWSAVAQLETPRFHHRLLAVNSGALLAVAGASRSGHVGSIDVIVLRASNAAR